MATDFKKRIEEKYRQELANMTIEERINEKYQQDLRLERQTIANKKKEEDDIAPVKKERNYWFEKGAFSDGYDFGDVTKSILGTAADIGLGAAKGVGGLLEGVNDFAWRRTEDVAEALGADNFAKKAKGYADKDSIDSILKPAEDFVKPYTLAGGLVQQTSQALGQVGGIIATGGLGAAAGLGSLGATALTTGTMFMSSAGSNESQAYKEGATEKEAKLYGTIAGTADAITELMFGGLGKSLNIVGLNKGMFSADDLLAKKVSEKVSNQIAKNFAEFGIKASGEGLEEVAAGLIQAVGKKITYMEEEELGKIIEDEDLLNQFVVGAITSGIVQSRGLVNSNKAGRDYVTGLSANEQKVIDSEVKNRTAEKQKKAAVEAKVSQIINERERTLGTLTDAEKKNIQQSVQAQLDDGTLDYSKTEIDKKELAAIEKQVREDLDLGYIGIDTIENTLAGEKTAQINELKAELDKTTNEAKKAEIQAKINELTADRATQMQELLRKDVYLQESYRQEALRGQEFTREASDKDSDITKELMESAKAVGMNNTRKMHNLFEYTNKIANDSGTKYGFVNNKQLKELGHEVEGVNINGLVRVDKDGKTKVLINVDSDKALNTIIGHETTHLMEGTSEYKALQDIVKQYATTKGDYDVRLQNMKKLYEGVDTNLENEITADLVGDYLFTDEQFIKELTTNRNVFQKIYDYIKHAYKMATAGSQEKRQLEKVKRSFDKAYKEMSKTATKQTETNSTTEADSSTKKIQTEEAMSKKSQSNPQSVFDSSIAENSEDGKKQYSLSDDNIKDYSTGYSYGETFFRMQYVENDEELGWISYGDYEGEPSIKMMEVSPEHRRKGIGRKLLQALQKKYPDTEINFGMTTPDGTRLVENATYQVENKEVQAKLERIKEIQAKLSEYDRVYEDFYNDKIPDPGEDYADDYNDLEYEMRELQREVRGKSTTKTFVKYSLSDSDGRKLTQAQQEYFKNSKVRDENGSLKVMYHGTPAGDFTVFKDGTYFTDNKEYADRYQNPSASSISSGKEATNPKTFEVYLDIKKPFDLSDLEAREIYINDYIKGGNAMGINPYLPDSEYAKIQTIDWTEGEDLRDFLIDEGYDYDGLVLDEGADGGYGEEVQYRGKSYVVFSPNQIKNVNNANPTADPDIRYSLSVSDYGMSHRPSTDYGDGSNFEENMPDVFEHPEWYFRKSEAHNMESLRALRKVRGNPEGEITIYRATIGDTINEGDWISPSKKYAEMHNWHSLDGKGKILELKVKAKDIRFAGDDINEFGYFPNGVDAYSLSRFDEQLAEKRGYNVYRSDVLLPKARTTPAAPVVQESRTTEDIAPVKPIVTSPEQQITELIKQLEGFTELKFDRAQLEGLSHEQQVAELSKRIKFFTEIANDSMLLNEEDNMRESMMQRALREASREAAPVVIPEELRYEEGQPLTEEDLPYFEQERSWSFDNITEEDLPAEVEEESYSVPNTAPLDDKSLRMLAKNMKEELSLKPKQVKGLEKIIQDFSTSEESTRETLYEMIEEEFGTIYSDSKIDEVVQVKKDMRDLRVMVSDTIKGDIPDYFQWKQKNFGKIRFSNQGQPVDVVYEELSFVYPGYFPADITNPTDQLLKMAEVANLDSVYTEEYFLPEEQIQDVTDFIYESVLDYKQEMAMKAAHETNAAPIDESLIPFEPKVKRELPPSNFDSHDFTESRGVQQEYDMEAGEIVDDTHDIELERLEKRKQKALDSLGDLTSYTKQQAKELYDEVRMMQKGKKVSGDLGFILDRMFEGVDKNADNYEEVKDATYKKITDALLAIERSPVKPERQVPPTEALIRNSIEIKYGWRVSEIEGMKLDSRAEARRKLRKELIGVNAEGLTKALDDAKNVPMMLMNNTDTIRNTELVFGRENGKIINEAIFQKEIDNEAKSIAWQNKERAEIAALGIKAKDALGRVTKESAAVQKYGEKQYVNEFGDLVKYGDDELAAEFSDVETQAKIRKAARIIRDKYDAYIDLANETLTKLGFEPIKKRSDYMRHFQELSDVFSRYGIPFNAEAMQEHDLPTDINGLTDSWSPQKNYFANMQPRKGQRTTLDAITGIDGYIGGIANLIYHTEDIQRGRAFEEIIRETYGQEKGWENLEALEGLSPEEYQARADKIQDNHLSNYAAWVHEWTNNVAGKKSKVDRSIESMFGRKAFALLDQVRKQVGSNMIGMNLSSSLTNLIAPVQAASKTKKLAVVKGTADTIKNIFVKDDFMEKNSFLTARMGTDMLSKTPWQKMQDAGYVFMKGMDWFSSNQIVRSKYYELLSKGMSEEQAHAEAGKFAARIMGDRTKGAQAQLYNSKLIGLVTQFQLEVNNQLYSMFYDTYHESKEAAKKNAAKTAAGMTFTLGQLAAMTHVFGQTFESIAGYNPTFDIIGIIATALGAGDDDDEKTTSERLKNAADKLVDALPYVNVMTGGGRIPIASGIPNPIAVMTGAKDNYGNERTWGDELEKLRYLVLPTGGNQIKKTMQGLSMFDEDLPVSGSYTDSGNLRFPVEDTPLNRVQAGLFGQWASGNARDYFDNERQPLKEKQIQEYADLDIPIADYWKYREGLKDKETIEAKFDYVAGLDLPVSKKNIMINNLVDREEEVDLTNYSDFGSYEEFDFAANNRQKYDWLQANNVPYGEYNRNEVSREAYNWAYKNQEGYAVSKAVSDVVTYRQISGSLYDIKADKDSEGKSISGSRKEKVASYINGLDLDYGAKLILFKGEYPSYDDANMDIIDYLNGREDISYNDMVTILTELGFTVDAEGNIHW